MRKSVLLEFSTFAATLGFNTAAQSQAEQCSPSLAGFARDGYPSEQALALGDCNPHWAGMLLTTGVSARVTAAADASLPTGYLDAVVAALQEADRATALLATEPDNPGRAVEFIIAGPSTRSAGNYGETLSRGDVCHVILFEPSWAPTDWAAEIGPPVAHEFFHCIQAAMTTNLYLANPTWALEGSATWFEHQVYSGVPLAFVDAFENDVSRITFNTFDDATWVFFAWIAQPRGVDGIIPYLQGLPDISETADGVIDALTPEQWADFAIAWAERDIFTRDRRRIQPNTYAPVHAVAIPADTDGEQVPVPRGRAQLMRHEVTLPPGVWRIRGQGGTVARWSQLDDGGRPLGPWRDMAAGFNTSVECQGETTFMVTGCSDNDEDYAYSVDFIEETCGAACGEAPRSIDQCVIGSWEVVDAANDFRDSPFMTLMQGFAMIGGGSIDQVDVLSETYSFTSEGDFVSNRPMIMSGRGNDGVNDFEVTMDVRVNEDRGRWGTNGRRMTLCIERNVWEATISGAVPGEGRGSEDIRTDQLVTDEDPIAARYSCESDRLTLFLDASFFFAGEPIEMRRMPAQE